MNTGGRISELLALTIDDVYQDRKPVTDLLFDRSIVKGGEMNRAVLVNSDGQRAISDLIDWHRARYGNTNSGCPLFPSRNEQGNPQRMSRRTAHNVLKAAFEAAGLNGHLTTHSLRKSFAQRLYDRTGDIFAVQEMLRHKSIATTQKYLGINCANVRDAKEHSMSKEYEHKGLPFTKQIAAELIFKTYVGKSFVDETILPKQIYQIHEARGGLLPESKLSESDSFNIGRYVRQALSGLHTNGCATRESGHLWYIHKMNIHRDEREYPKTLGKGSQEVYCYYYRAYREIAVLTKIDPVWKIDIGKILWECKIGETHEQDTPTRIKQQIGVPPEQPVIALILKTDDSQRLEDRIHEILKYWDREISEAQGKEWFLTSPDEVENIYQELQHGFTF